MVNLDMIKPGDVLSYEDALVSCVGYDSEAGFVLYHHLQVGQCPDRRCGDEAAFHQAVPFKFACNATVEIPADEETLQ